MIPLKDREVKVVLDDIPDDEAMVSALHIPAGEGAAVDALLTESPMPEDDESHGMPAPIDEAMLQRAEDGDYMMSIGSSFVSKKDSVIMSDTEDETVSSDEADDQWDDMEEEIDDYMSSAVASFKSGVTPEHLSKV